MPAVTLGQDWNYTVFGLAPVGKPNVAFTLLDSVVRSVVGANGSTDEELPAKWTILASLVTFHETDHATAGSGSWERGTR